MEVSLRKKGKGKSYLNIILWALEYAIRMDGQILDSQLFKIQIAIECKKIMD